MHHGAGKHQPSHHDPSKAPDCPFAPLIAAGLPPISVAKLPTPPAVDALAYWRPRPTTFLTAGSSRLPPSTGPPALA